MVKKIVIIEDDENHAKVFDLGLQKSDFPTQVTVLSSELEVQAWLETWTDEDCPDLILLDLNLGGCSGLELLGRLRRIMPLSRVPILVLSSSANPHHLQEAYAQGANSYMLKPISFDQTLRNLRAVCEFWLVCHDVERDGVVSWGGHRP